MAQKLFESLNRHYVPLYLWRISLQNKYLYAPIGKVANSSIKAALYELECDPKIFFYSKRSEQFRRTAIHDPFFGPLMSPVQFAKNRDFLSDLVLSDRFYRFVFVRNPYTRLVSAFLDRAQFEKSELHRWLIGRGLTKPFKFEEFVRALATANPETLEQHVRPQTKLSCYGEIEWDFVGKFENLNEDFAAVTRRVYGKTVKLQNVSPKKIETSSSLSRMYSKDCIDLVQEIYKEDFSTFSYSEEPPWEISK